MTEENEKHFSSNARSQSDRREELARFADQGQLSQETQSAQSEKILARTFTEAEQRPKQLSDELIVQLLTDTVKGADGKRVMMFKTYLDQVPASEGDERMIRSPERIAHFHRELADMITDNFTLYTQSLSPVQRDYLAQQKNAYIDRLQKDTNIWSDMVRDFSQTGMIEKGFTEAASFFGFGVQTSEGGRDITDEHVRLSSIRSNITVQREIGGQFVHWRSKAWIEASQRGQAEVARRIYLNPDNQALVDIFSELMKSFEEEGLPVHGKILDRSIEMVNKMRVQETPTVRADGIVLALDEATADRVLEHVLRVVEAHPDAFRDRPAPRVAAKIGPGVAVGDEPKDVGNKSLTQHRSELIEFTVDQIRQRLRFTDGSRRPGPVTPQEITSFRRLFSRILSQNGVDPNNLAFNTKQV